MVNYEYYIQSIVYQLKSKFLKIFLLDWKFNGKLLFVCKRHSLPFNSGNLKFFGKVEIFWLKSRIFLKNHNLQGSHFTVVNCRFKRCFSGFTSQFWLPKSQNFECYLFPSLPLSDGKLQIQQMKFRVYQLILATQFWKLRMLSVSRLATFRW